MHVSIHDILSARIAALAERHSLPRMMGAAMGKQTAPYSEASV